MLLALLLTVNVGLGGTISSYPGIGVPNTNDLVLIDQKSGASFTTKTISVGNLLSNQTFEGTTVFASPPAVYGSAGTNITFQGVNPPFVDSNGGVLRMGGHPAYGFQWLSGVDYSTLMTLGVNSTTANAENIPRTYIANAKSITGTDMGEAVGASVTSYSPLVGGNFSSGTGLPPHGDDVWNRLPVPPVQFILYNLAAPFTNHCNESYMTNLINTMRNANLIQVLTNNGIPVFVDIELWMAQTRASGHLQANNQFPSGMPYIGRYCATSGCPAELHVDYSAVYAATMSGVPPGEWCAMTPNSLQTDIADFYSWGVGAIRVADGTTSDVARNRTGFQHQMHRQVADALLYPSGNTIGSAGYSTNPIVFDCFIPTLQLKDDFLPSAMFECNNFADDQGRYGGPNSGQNIGRAMYQARLTATNYAKYAGAGHYCSEVYADDSPLSTTDLEGHMAIQCSFPSFFSIFSNNVNTVVSSHLTNSDYLAILKDPLQQPGFFVYDGGNGSTSCIVKPLVGGAYSVVLANETAGALNMSCYWSNMVSPRGFVPIGHTPYPIKVDTNQTFAVYNIWAGSRIGQQQKVYTVSVPAHSLVWVRFDPVTIANTLIDLAASQFATTNTVITDGGNSGFLALDRGNAAKGVMNYCSANTNHYYSWSAASDIWCANVDDFTSTFYGQIRAATIGTGLSIKTGTNAKIGTATLVGGAATVSNTSVTSNSRIFLCSNTDGGTPGWLRVSAKSNGTSFTITSSSGTDTSTVAWLIVESIP